jgi:predicted metal-binding protein
MKKNPNRRRKRGATKTFSKSELEHKIIGRMMDNKYCILAVSRGNMPQTMISEYYAQGLNVFIPVDDELTIENIRNNPLVSVAIFNSSHTNTTNQIALFEIQMRGKASLHVEEDKSLFPGIPHGRNPLDPTHDASDLNQTQSLKQIIRVKPFKIEYWEPEMTNQAYSAPQIWENLEDKSNFHKDLEPFCDSAIESGATSVKIIDPHRVITGSWVPLKCQYGSRRYGKSPCCPPYSPTPEKTRRVLDGYNRAILFHFHADPTTDWAKDLGCFHEALRDLEKNLFKAGYYRAFVYLSGPCFLCKTCAILKDEHCVNPMRARPSMEACGIDVFRTVRNAGFEIHTLSEKGEVSNHFCLMLVD